ncbi:MAG: U32 family peptidase [Clostridia bacterium]|nr:U32 family peptidase [Clostridia bacterium]
MELLLPAGSPDALVGAVQSGADAVYLGGEKFGARRGAKNFNRAEMKAWIDYCHLYGVKVYVTVNTLVKDGELEELAQYVRDLSDMNADAVLVQDFGVLEVIKEAAPMLPVHASTQMTVTAPEDVDFLEKQGFSRVVLSRELSASEIKRICSECSCEIEVFVHGALCMSYSGQCLFSSIIGGRSGNRGCCAQPCRLPYALEKDGRTVSNGFLLSPRDLCLAPRLRELKESGAASLKVEGRLKRPEYAATVAEVYRRCIDNNFEFSAHDMRLLSEAFGRGFTQGLYGGERGRKMMNFENSSNAAENIFTDDVKRRCREDANFKKIPVFIHGEAKIGKTIKVTISGEDGTSVSAEGDIRCAEAVKSPTGAERFKSALQKLGATPYECMDITVDIDNNAAVPVSEINAVRRAACEKMTELRIFREKRETAAYFVKSPAPFKRKPLNIVCDVTTAKQAEAAFELGIKTVFAPAGVLPEKTVTKCPPITKGTIVSGNSFCISNAGQLEICGKRAVYGGQRLNITNSVSADFYCAYLKGAVLSPELRFEEIKDITSRTRLECGAVAYGRLDLMLCENCPVKAAGQCTKGKSSFFLRDRKGERFPLVCSEGCRMRILNSKPVYMADKWSDIEKSGLDFVSLVFTLEDREECSEIIKAYLDAAAGKAASPMKENTFTRGHFYRGVL